MIRSSPPCCCLVACHVRRLFGPLGRGRLCWSFDRTEGVLCHVDAFGAVGVAAIAPWGLEEIGGGRWGVPPSLGRNLGPGATFGERLWSIGKHRGLHVGRIDHTKIWRGLYIGCWVLFKVIWLIFPIGNPPFGESIVKIFYFLETPNQQIQGCTRRFSISRRFLFVFVFHISVTTPCTNWSPVDGSSWACFGIEFFPGSFSSFRGIPMFFCHKSRKRNKKWPWCPAISCDVLLCPIAIYRQGSVLCLWSIDV